MIRTIKAFLILWTFFSFNFVQSTQYASQSYLGEEKTEKLTYRGYTYEKRIEDIRATALISLSGQYTKEISHTLEKSDQFIICIMYRFAHPAIMQAFTNKYLQSQQQKNSCIPIIFLDYNQYYTSEKNNKYRSYVRHLIDNTPCSFVRLHRNTQTQDKNKSFHHKILICKQKSQKAVTFIGSANATYESDYCHSEDTLMLQSNTLAYNILNQLDLFLKSEFIKIYDEHKFEKSRSNISYLQDCLTLLKNDKASIFKKNFGYKTSVETFGISNGMNDPTCYNIIKKEILEKKDDRLLIYFENYFNVSSFEEIKSSIEKPPLKLIVVCDKSIQKDSNNALFFRELKDNQNENYCLIQFKPYTGFKFHHKMIIQYPEKGAPNLYTGSFHFARNAVQNNSENIICVKSEELVQDYLSSILWNSNLGQEVDIWKFLLAAEDKVPTVIGPKIHSVAVNFLSKCENNLNKYSERLFNFIERLEDTLPSELTHSKNIELLKTKIMAFDQNEDLEKKRKIIETIYEDIFSFNKNTTGYIFRNHVNERINYLIENSSLKIEISFQNWLSDFHLFLKENRKNVLSKGKKELSSKKKSLNVIENHLTRIQDNNLRAKKLDKKLDKIKSINSNKLKELRENYSKKFKKLNSGLKFEKNFLTSLGTSQSLKNMKDYMGKFITDSNKRIIGYSETKDLLNNEIRKIKKFINKNLSEYNKLETIYRSLKDFSEFCSSFSKLHLLSKTLKDITEKNIESLLGDLEVEKENLDESMRDSSSEMFFS